MTEILIKRPLRLPEWIRPRHDHSELRQTKRRLRISGVSTVCEEARCPNKGECFKRPTATFMILGTACTRRCGFCSVTPGEPPAPDPEEPLKVAHAAREMALKYVIVTSVTRDDLPDGGAGHFALTIRAIREALPSSRVEVLTPDFRGVTGAIATVLDAGPDVFNHNVETVPSLYGKVRPQADYGRSLAVLKYSKRHAPHILTKSGLMLGVGETRDEVLRVLMDLRDAGCDMLTVGQYLRPSRRNIPVVEYVRPEVFEALGQEARRMGFRFVASSPLVRSSMNAEELFMTEERGGNV